MILPFEMTLVFVKDWSPNLHRGFSWHLLPRAAPLRFQRLPLFSSNLAAEIERF